MKIGTKSVLFGAHCFFIHPWFVALGWWKLYGFPWDPRLWFVFFLHDLGYWGKPNMDGEEGETHVEWGARMVSKLFDKPHTIPKKWYYFSLLHSRFYAKKFGMNPSKLCAADKLAIALEPWWLYLARVNLTGEVKEYMKLAQQRTEAGEGESWKCDKCGCWQMHKWDICRSAYDTGIYCDGRKPTTSKYATMNLDVRSQRAWFESMCTYLRGWANEHKGGGKEDTWTPDMKKARDTHGVWQ